MLRQRLLLVQSLAAMACDITLVSASTVILSYKVADHTCRLHLELTKPQASAHICKRFFSWLDRRWEAYLKSRSAVVKRPTQYLNHTSGGNQKDMEEGKILLFACLLSLSLAGSSILLSHFFAGVLVLEHTS